MHLRVNEVAKEIKESVHVVRNWIRDFRAYIPMTKSEAGYNLFDQEAVKIIRTIQRLARKQKYTTRQIEHFLSTGGDPFGSVPEEKERDQKLDEILTRLDRQEEFNRALVQQLDEQRQHIENLVQQRDKQLMLTLRELGAARARQKKLWYKFWQ